MNKKKRGFTSRRHPELDSGSSRIFNKGFTLLEVLVVVLIIGVLTAIAVPQYQKAVLKSRFSSLMPITKAIRDGNEAYFLGRGQYSNVLADLDITTKSGEETTVELSDDDDYAYVLSHRSDNPKNNLIMYQKHSANYPGEIHCEALQEDEQANWLCETGMNATQNIGTVLTSGYTTYVLEGTGAGLPPGADEEEAGTISCAKAENMGFSCSVTTNAQGKQEKKICKNGVCRTKTYNEEGSYTRVTCSANSEGVCTSKWYSATYDANGNKTSQRTCSTVAADGSCSAYSNSGAHDYTYDANGNRTSQRNCDTVASDGSCNEYSNSNAYDYTYDANGNQTSVRSCSTIAADGSCSAYSNSGAHDYTYDANGNMTSQRTCSTVAADGSCSAYSNSSAYDYTYDANGNMTSARRCSTVAADGSCSAYSNSDAYDYTYDANGNMTSARRCSTVAADGSCSAYKSGTDLTYDEDGKRMVEQYCSGANVNTATGECIAYSITYVKI